VLYPLLEDIQLAMETSSRKFDDDDQVFYTQTFESILCRFDLFIKDNFDTLEQIVPCYIDIFCLFIVRTSQRRLA